MTLLHRRNGCFLFQLAVNEEFTSATFLETSLKTATVATATLAGTMRNGFNLLTINT